MFIASQRFFLPLLSDTYRFAAVGVYRSPAISIASQRFRPPLLSDVHRFPAVCFYRLPAMSIASQWFPLPHPSHVHRFPAVRPPLPTNFHRCPPPLLLLPIQDTYIMVPRSSLLPALKPVDGPPSLRNLFHPGGPPTS